MSVYISESPDWVFYFGKHMRPQVFRSIREYQKVSRSDVFVAAVTSAVADKSSEFHRSCFLILSCLP